MTDLNLADYGTFNFTVSGELGAEKESITLRHMSPRELEDFNRDILPWVYHGYAELKTALESGAPTAMRTAYRSFVNGLIDIVTMLAVAPREPELDADDKPLKPLAVRTVEKFYDAMKYRYEALNLWTEILKSLGMAGKATEAEGGLPEVEDLQGKSEEDLIRLGGRSASSAPPPTTSRSNSRKAIPSAGSGNTAASA